MAESNGTNVMVQGRIVWTSGKLFEGRPKVDQLTKAPRLNAKGEQQIEYGFGLAIPKSVLNDHGPGRPGEVWAALNREAAGVYPNGQVPPGFAMKFKDGDTIDDKGRPFAEREGYAGHIVLACTTTIPIKFFRFENGQNFQVNDGIKCGDYVNVQLNIKGHPATGQAKAGLYVNPNAVQFVAYGKEIVNAPSGDQIFGAVAPVIPQGGSATPIAPTGGFLTPPQGFQQPQQQAAPSFAQPGYPPQVPQQAAPPAPHFGVLPPQHQPPQQAAPSFAQPGYPPQGLAPSNGMPAMPGFPPFNV